MSESDETGPPTAAHLDAVLQFQPTLEARSAGAWAGGERRTDGTLTAPWFDYDRRILEFIRACGENGMIEVFDWPAWEPEAIRLYENPDLLAEADLATIRKLLTLHIRKDRFSEGHLAAMVEVGHISAILTRLAEIRRSLPLR